MISIYQKKTEHGNAKHKNLSFYSKKILRTYKMEFFSALYVQLQLYTNQQRDFQKESNLLLIHQLF